MIGDYVTRVIPHLDHRLREVMFVAQRAEARGAQYKESSGPGFEPHPAGGEHTQEMAAGKKQNPGLRGSHPGQHAVTARADLLGGLAAGAAVAEELPIGTHGVNLIRSEAFVFTVIPFEQVRIDIGDGAEAGELARAPRALQWACKNQFEIQSGQPLSQRTGVLLAVFGQGQIGPPRVLAGETPRRFAVPGQVDKRKLLGAYSVSLIAMLAFNARRAHSSPATRRRRGSVAYRVKLKLGLDD